MVAAKGWAFYVIAMAESRSIKLSSVAGAANELGTLHQAQVQPGKLDPRMALLKQWQANRLARTYADVAELPRYGAVMEFFLQDIYAARDFTQRNHDMQRMYEFMRHLAPDGVVRPLVLTVRLHETTERLDTALLDRLVRELGMKDSLTIPLYAEAYRRCGNYDERVEQIELICEIGVLIDKAVHMPFGGTVLAMARSGLKRGGWSELLGLMDRGHKVFKQVPDTPKLMSLIRNRELRILDQIYAGHPDPFQTGES